MSAPEEVLPDLREDTRNVSNDFKYFPIEIIKQRLAERRRPFATMCLNLDKDLNVATTVRTHNAFCGEEFFWLGRRKFYRPGSVGAYLYETMTHLQDLDEARAKLGDRYTWIGVDNRPGAIPVTAFEYPERPLFIFGHEREGLDFLPQLPYYCQSIISIPQAGSVRSLNVGVSSGIIMYDFCLKRGYLSEDTLPKRTLHGGAEHQDTKRRLS